MTAQKNFRVDSFVAGLALKAPCNAFSDVDLTLYGEQTVNGVVLLAKDRCLVMAQDDPIENGIWDVQATGWQRSQDFDGNRDVVGSTLVGAYADGELSIFSVDGAPDSVAPGTDAITFTLFFSGSDWRNTTINNIIFGAFTILDQVLTSASGVLTFDYELGQSMFIDLTENVTSIVFDNLPLGNLKEMELEILQDAGSAYTIVWPASFEWSGGTEPDVSALSGTTLVHMRSRDDGVKWLGTIAPEFS